MGQTPFDKYSLLHFLSGVGAKYVGLDFYTWCVVHLVFEATENTESGIKFINDNFPWWPGGGKTEADSWSNIYGDQTSALVGWWVAKRWL